MRLINWVSEIKEKKKFFLIFFGIVVFAFLPFLNPFMFSFDDYNLFFKKINNPELVGFSVSMGRWFGIFLVNIFQKFTGNGSLSGVYFSFFLVFFQWGVSALVLAKQFKLDTTKWYLPVILSIGFIHVFGAEIFTFKVALLVNEGFSFIYIFTFLGWFLIKKFDKWFFVGVIFIVFALASYQVFINILLVITLLGFVIAVIDAIKEEHKISLKFIFTNEYAVKLYGIMTATVSYYLINKLILSLWGVSDSARSVFISVDALGERVIAICRLFRDILFVDNAFLLPLATKSLLFLVIAFAIITSIMVITKSKSYTLSTKMGLGLFVLILFVVALTLTAFASLLLSEWWVVPRMLTGFGFFVMFCFLIVLRFNQRKVIRNVLVLFSVFIAFSFININHNIANDQQYLNFVDRNKALRIVSEIEKIEGYKDKKIYIHQRPDCWETEANIFYIHGDMNMSAFCTSWSKYELLQFVSGEKYKRTTQEENNYLDSLYNLLPDTEKPRWPSNNGIVVYDSIIAIYP